MDLPRYPKEHHALSHAAIVVAASQQLRAHGYDGLSIAEVMKAVGMTHGGFYAHFKDRDELIKKAMIVAFDQSEERFEHLVKVAMAKGDNGLIAIHYLSDDRVSDIASGCPVVALSADRQRMPKSLQKNFDEGVEKTRKVLAGHFQSRGKADAALAMLFGTLQLIRTSSDAVRVEMRERASDYLRRL